MTLVSGRNLLLGNAAVETGSFEGVADVSGVDVVLTAVNDITLDDFSFVSAHGAGAISATAGGNISLVATGTAFNGASIVSQGGNISLTTGAGGTGGGRSSREASAGGVGIDVNRGSAARTGSGTDSGIASAESRIS